ncbi:MAG: ATP-binding protein [Vicinamibacterales bacterium]
MNARHLFSVELQCRLWEVMEPSQPPAPPARGVTIHARLITAAVASTLLVTVVGSIGVLNRQAVEQGLGRVEQSSLPTLRALEDLRFAAVRIVASTSEYALIRRLKHDDAGAPTPDSERGSDAADGEARLREAGAARYEAAFVRLKAALADRVLTLDVAELDRRGQRLQMEAAAVVALADSAVPAPDLFEGKERFEAAEVAFLSLIDASVEMASADLRARSQAVRERVARDAEVSVFVLVVASAVTLLAGLGLAASIRRPLAVLQRATTAIAAGRRDVTLPVATNDEIGAVARAYGSMVEALEATTVSLRFVDDVIASIPDGVLVLDADGRVTRANPAAVALIGEATPGPLTGRRVSDLMPDAAPSTGTASSAMVSLLRVDGSTLPIALTISPLTSDRGEAGYVCLVQDVRERLASERALMEARDAAESGARAKGQFLATMSHELRTPLNAIIGYAELLQEDAPGLPEDARRDLERIRAAGLLLLHLVNEILDLARIEAGRVEVTAAVTPVDAMIAEVADIVRPMLSSRTRLELDLSPLPPIVTDAGKLRQILINVLSNACKFTDEGVVRIRARANGAGVDIEVVDTGRGMPAEFVRTIFAPFSQAHPARPGRHAGTGLGMAIVQRLCDLLQASIAVHSVEGAGTTVSLRLPRAVSPARPAAA